MTNNFTLRDEIREYWARRAEGFDAQPGHGITDGAEKTAWLKMLQSQLGLADGRNALDLACGTGEISHLLHDFGLNVTGLDWSEAMLTIAREKAERRKSGIRFLTGDAEDTREVAASYDVIITRHLVWTLVDPSAAFAHWYSLLKPGGTLLIIDGDFVNDTLLQKLFKWLNLKLGQRHTTPCGEDMKGVHQSILSRVYFSKGAKSGQVTDLLHGVGFRDVSVQTNLSEIQKAQAARMGFFTGLERKTQHRYIIRALK